MKLLSVIVPVYNVEQYLETCISSICNQSYTNIEIIIVDDGSTDNSSNICDELAHKDKRISVFHQANSGGGKARNVGLSMAKGEYIAFVDSDDFIAPSMYETMINLMKDEIDIIECDYLAVNSNALIESVKFDKEGKNAILYDAEEAMAENIKDTVFRQLIWNKVYRREVIKGVRFPEQKGIDDEFWTYKVIGNSKKLGLSSAKLYAYRQQDKSVMHTIDSHKRIRCLEAKIERYWYIHKNYPALIELCCINLWFTGLYCGQLVCRDKKNSNKKEEIRKIHNELLAIPFSLHSLHTIPLKQRIWLLLAKLSFERTCKIRTICGIGL